MLLCVAVATLEICAATISAQTGETDSYFHFRFPQPAAYRLEENAGTLKSAATKVEWLRAWPANGSTHFVEFGSRVVLQVQSTNSLPRLLAGSPLTLSRAVAGNVFILQAPDAPTAVREAGRLAAQPEALASYPVVRQVAGLHGPYAPQPVDPYFIYQWYLEQRDTNGAVTGPDMNVRAAWPYTRGEGVVVAVADLGVELVHPDLAPRIAGALNHNFTDSSTNGQPFGRDYNWAHGTEVAGLIAADGSNKRGMIGAAPAAQLASWVVFNNNLTLVSDEQLMDMYQFASNVVSVQNHSWGHILETQEAPTLLEQVGISNAVTFGRGGRGVVMVRSGGNSRTRGDNADDDGYLSDSRVIAVAAVRQDGRVASYSEPGACVLVAAPSGDQGDGLFTTDLVGTDGVNGISFLPPNQDLSDYVFDSLGFSGTSTSAPLVSGVVALMLSANPNLTYRDVQQILILASRHFDLADPDLTTNGAGLRVSHNVGFGVPDAGQAVWLARGWSNRPPLTHIILTKTNSAAIPDDGLRLLISGDGVPVNLASIRTLPGTGPHADTPTAMLPLVDVGLATNPITANLTNKAALIERGTNLFPDKINFAAQAGAAFAVIYNFATNTSGVGAPGGDQLIPLGGTDFTPIPAVFIGHSDGEALKSLFATNSGALAQIHLQTTNYLFIVTNTLLCEHVAVRVRTDHPLRGDVRLTLVSPQGTRSVLQRYNADTNAGPVDWIYYSTHHFFESSAGTWTLAFSDELQDATGSVQFAGLNIGGVAITDADHDGLDDDWEMARFGTLDYGPQDDPDGDGYNNSREQIMGTDPLAADAPFQLDLSPWDNKLARLSWPGVTNLSYGVLSGTNAAALTLLTNLPGRFPETEWFAPYTNQAPQFFRVRAVSAP